jgi:cobalt-precorrin-7 (C5)-methyltransferase
MGVDAPWITIVGCGPGSPDYVTPAARAAVERAEALVGAKRLLDLFPSHRGKRVEVTTDIDKILASIGDLVEAGSVAVLVSGDPGLFSLCRLVIERFGTGACRVIAGVSSVQAAFAKIGLDWSDAHIISAHKRDPDLDPRTLLEADKIAILGGRQGAADWIADLLKLDYAKDRKVFVCEDLTLESERVSQVAPAELGTLELSTRVVILIVKGELPA